LIVTLPLVLLPMRWSESARIAGACWVVYVALVVALGRAGVVVAVGYSALAALAMAPGMVFSAWRYSRFDAKFRHEDLRGRFGELSKELEQARKLHEALFPVVVEDGPERVRVKFVYEPMREIGGDFVFVHRVGGTAAGALGRGDVYVVLIDVSGHGVAAALAVNRMHGELVRMFGTRGGGEMSAGTVIENLNAYVYLTLAPQGVYATAVCVRVSGGGEGSAWELEWANAGHPPALLRSGAAAGGEVHRLEPTTTMLGVIEPEVFEGHARRMGMGPGDVVVAYTDGLTEARGETGEEYGSARVEAVVRGVGMGAADALARGVGAHRAGRVKDDLLVVEVGVVGAAAAPVESENRLQVGSAVRDVNGDHEV
jgi:serine phosphatase RsbU (regulator of sigma subunit)